MNRRGDGLQKARVGVWSKINGDLSSRCDGASHSNIKHNFRIRTVGIARGGVMRPSHRNRADLRRLDAKLCNVPRETWESPATLVDRTAQRALFRVVPALRSGGGYLTIPSVLDETRLRQLLEPFGLDLTAIQAGQVLAYLHLLLRWNEKINLTAIRDPGECVTRHFGESLFLARHMELHGNLLDIGSGAGFPGLALKIPFPELSVTLLEPVAKKRAFLKEAARACRFAQVEVRGERLEDWVRATPAPAFDFATMRAVGNLDALVPPAARCLKPGGNLLLWLSQDQAAGLATIESALTWGQPLPIPLTRTGVIWRGIKPAN